jgi:hypothetical protein
MLDCAPARFGRALLYVFNNTYHDRRIGRGGPIALPPRSPDLNPLDFYMWRRLETLVNAAPVDTKRHFTIALGSLSDCPKLPRHL